MEKIIKNIIKNIEKIEFLVDKLAKNLFWNSSKNTEKNTQNIQNNKLNFLQKIKNRDKISIMIWMFSFLIILNATDFSWLKANLLWTWTWEIIEEKTEKIALKEEKNIEPEILEEEKKEPILEENIKNPILIENPILVENKVEKTEENLNINFIEKNNKNDEKLAEIEKNKWIEVISEIVLDRENILNNENKKEENLDLENKNNNSFEENNEEKQSKLDKKILEAIEEIKNIEEENTDIKRKNEEVIKRNDEIIQENILKEKQAEEDKKIKESETEIVVEEKKNEEKKWLSEDDFSISAEETISHNESVKLAKKEKEKEIQDNKLKVLEEEKRLLEERLSGLEESILSKSWWEKNEKQISLREKNKRKKAEELKIKNEELEEKKRIEKIQQDKIISAKNSFYFDSDKDWISDHIEELIETNWKLIDTDWDWYSESIEIDKFFNPNWKWALFPDIVPKDKNKDIIIKWVKKWLVFVRAWDDFLKSEKIYRYEAVQVIVSALYPNEIFREPEYFSWTTLYSDVSENENFSIYLRVAIKHNIFDWIIADDFAPYETFSKAEFISILVKWTEKKLSKKQTKWVDTETDNWFSQYFSTAKELKIITKSTSARIFPLEKITRINAVEYALRASKYKFK